MIREGRQFIPREEGDPELTESELTSNTDNKAFRLLKRAGMAAVIGAAMLHAESAPAQELSSLEKQKMEEVGHQFSDEYHCKLLVELVAQHRPELEPFLSGAMVREADSRKAGKFAESNYYLYLPAYDVVLTLQYNNSENEPTSDSDEEQKKNMDKGMQEFIGGLLRELARNGLIEMQKDPTGEIKLVPHYRSQSGKNRAMPEVLQ